MIAFGPLPAIAFSQFNFLKKPNGAQSAVDTSPSLLDINLLAVPDPRDEVGEQAGGGAKQVVTSAQLVGAVPSCFAKTILEALAIPSNEVEYKNLLLSLNAMIMFLDFVLYQIPLQYNIYHK